ncbi:SusC/RagA family TonB-linked outer membrane protein [Fulvivirgaceae bacterium BMA10]|uniref:SusC/RagA family TonB-linked outer membrane protein n=1 Tax=Splendidivirga corallicola TaxID=3051826 RepID=A0ABT8KJ22_9BACT|nr:SusC/RagA family TonB-linked outer membrane protein [Fulvivirgaceae bacterium BMA10]
MKQTLLSVIIYGLFCLQPLLAQTKITGTVRSLDDNQPLPGVNIIVEGNAATGTITDANGEYTISAPANAVLIFSYIGYELQKINVENRNVIDVSLATDLQELKEVVVTAFGIKREKKALGYSVSEVSSEDIAGNGEINAISSLSGKVAGVNIAQTTAGPTGSKRVIIRGISEVDGDNQPLYVIDGVPVDNSTLGQASQWGGFDLGDGLSDINPDDIESISVLKGASAAALYGTRALNGVILITTKSGSKNRKGLGVELSNTTTFDQISTRLDERQLIYGQGSNGRLPRDGNEARNVTSNWGPRLSNDLTIDQLDGTTRPFVLIPDNVKDLFRTGRTFNTSLAVTGETENSSIRFSVANIDNEDILPKSELRKNSFSLRGSTKLAEVLTLDAKVNYITENVKNRPALTDEVTNIGNGIIGLAPNFDQSWLQYYKDENGQYVDWTGNIFRANPYWTINETFNESFKDRIIGFASLKYDFNEKFSAEVKGGIDYYTFNHQEFYNESTPTREGGLMSENTIVVKETNYQGMLNYRTDIGDDFYVTASIGGNLTENDLKSTRITGTEIIIPEKASLINFKESKIEQSNPRKKIHSLFGFGQISYKEFLFLDLTARQDWSSTLPSDNNSYFYPSVSSSFVLTEAFNIDSDVLTFAKLRTSWAQVGGDTDPFRLNFTYSLTGRQHLGQALGAISGTVLPNPNLKPERTNSYEIGTDIRLFNDKIGLDLTYYNQVTNDLIMALPVPEVSGYQSAVVNAGELRNKGLEILLNATPINTNGFSWDISLNYARNKNTISSLHEDIKAITIADARWAGVKVVAKEGSEFGLITGKGYQRDDTGNIVHGADGLPLPTEEPIDLGSSLQDWTGGMINTFSYKGLSLKVALDVKVGGDIFAITNLTMYSSGAHSNTLEGRDGWNEYVAANTEARDAWIDAGNNPDDFVPLPISGGYIGKGVVIAGQDDQGNPIYEENTIVVNPANYWGFVASNIPEEFVYDLTYVKLRDLSLSYKLPSNLLKNLPFQSVKIGFVGRNLWTIFKNVPNIDPESTYNNGNGQGLEYGSLPSRRNYGFNVSLKF